MGGDELHETAVEPELNTGWVGHPYHYETDVGSTNDVMKAWVGAGSAQDPPAGTVLLADHQSAGRGRLGRQWQAPPGTSLLFSTLFRPDWPANQGGWLTMLAGLAVVEAIEAVAELPVGLKWPNDIMLNNDGQWRKVGGLLLDAQLQDDRLVHAIVGIGLNVNIAQADLPDVVTPATSLMVAGGDKAIPRRPLLLACLRQLEHHYEQADRGQSPWQAWNDRLITLGRNVTVTLGDGSPGVTGVAEGTDQWGGLLLRDAAGALHTLAAGDVTLRGGPRSDEERR